MNIVRRNKTPEMGNFWLALSEGTKELFSAKGGSVIEVAGKPAALSMVAVTALAGALLLVVVLKKKHVI